MFEVGDLVMVRKDLISGRHYPYELDHRVDRINGLYFAMEMNKFRGEICKVTRILYRGSYKQYNLSIGEEERDWVFNDGMLIQPGGLSKLVWKRKNLK